MKHTLKLIVTLFVFTACQFNKAEENISAADTTATETVQTENNEVAQTVVANEQDQSIYVFRKNDESTADYQLMKVYYKGGKIEKITHKAYVDEHQAPEQALRIKNLNLSAEEEAVTEGDFSYEWNPDAIYHFVIIADTFRITKSDDASYVEEYDYHETIYK